MTRLGAHLSCLVRVPIPNIIFCWSICRNEASWCIFCWFNFFLLHLGQSQAHQLWIMLGVLQGSCSVFKQILNSLHSFNGISVTYSRFIADQRWAYLPLKSQELFKLTAPLAWWTVFPVWTWYFNWSIQASMPSLVVAVSVSLLTLHSPGFDVSTNNDRYLVWNAL